MKFRKKPVVIEAVQWNGHPIVFKPWIDKLGALPFSFDESMNLKIRTLEGEMTADIGDWIIRGVVGEFYPCKHNVFAESYSAVGCVKSVTISYSEEDEGFIATSPELPKGISAFGYTFAEAAKEFETAVKLFFETGGVPCE